MRPAALLMIFLMLVPSLYYSVPPMVYDNASPLVVDDVRLGPQQWQSTAGFVSSMVAQRILYGVRLTDLYIGGQSSKEIWYLVYPESPQEFPGLRDWLALHPGIPAMMRISVLQVPEYDYSPNPAEWQDALSVADVLYSTGEVIILLNQNPS